MLSLHFDYILISLSLTPPSSSLKIHVSHQPQKTQEVQRISYTIGLLHCLPPRELRRLVYACVYVICVWGGVCSSALSERPSGEHLSVPFVLLCWQRRGQ